MPRSGQPDTPRSPPSALGAAMVLGYAVICMSCHPDHPDTGTPTCEVTRSLDSNGDGDADQSYEFTFDEVGYLIAEARDEGANGSVEQRLTYSRDTLGNVTEETLNGALILVSTYDDEGHRLLSETYASDGTPIGRYTWSYDASGNLLTFESDSDADDVVDLRVTLSYDDQGHLSLQVWDDAADGSVDASRTYEYDETGTLSVEDWDNDADGMVDERYMYSYDDGRLAMETHDADADGIADGQRSFSYDASGLLIEESADDGADGTVDEIVTYAYDSDGHILSEQREFSDDADPDQSWFYTYDSDGRTLSEEYHAGVDGVDTEVWTYNYDCAVGALEDTAALVP